MIDVEWTIANADYAREVIRLARATSVGELIDLANRIEDTHPLLPRIVRAEAIPQPVWFDAPKYVQSLR